MLFLNAIEKPKAP